MQNDKNILDNSSRVQLDEISAIYFIGIGGIGMSALARYFHSRGVRVSGYDKTETKLTRQLQEEGIEIQFDEDVSLIPKDIQLVVYTPAVPSDHKGLVYYMENGYKVVKRSDVLQAISENSFNICVAGTHGKTTISTMIAHILRHSGYGCNAFLGGISVNYDTNFWSSDNNVCVIEADEYDRSFLKLDPNIAVISSMDADHLDIYGDVTSMQDAFVAFGNKTREDGLLVSKFGLGRTRDVKADHKLSYSLQNDAADVYASDIRIDEGGYQYNIQLGNKLLQDMQLRIGGMHNVENSLVAVTVADSLKIDEEKIRLAVKEFKGVRRRFEYIIPPVKKQEGAYHQPVLVDDYAHHPEELRALLNSVRTLFPRRVLTVIFQPHLYTRTRDLADGFATVLSIADRVVLLPIYPAREEPIKGVSSEMILDKMEHKNKRVLTATELMNWLQAEGINKEFGEVVVMAGAGDIDTLVQPVKQIVEKL